MTSERREQIEASLDGPWESKPTVDGDKVTMEYHRSADGKPLPSQHRQSFLAGLVAVNGLAGDVLTCVVS